MKEATSSAAPRGGAIAAPFADAVEIVAHAAANVARAETVAEVGRLVVDQVIKLGASAAHLLMACGGDGSLWLTAERNIPADLCARLARVSRDLPLACDVAARTGRIQVIEDIHDLGPEAALVREMCDRTGTRAVVSVPLATRAGAIGVLTWFLRQPHAFSDAEVRAIAALGDVFAVGLDNAMARERQTRLVTQLEAVRRSVLDIGESLALPAVLKRIVDRARDIAKAEYAALGVYAGDDRPFNPWVSSSGATEPAGPPEPPPCPAEPLQIARRQKWPMRLTNLGREHLEGAFDGAPQLHSFLGVPILHRERFVGMVILINRIGGAEFTAEDEEGVALLCKHAALALERARIHERMVDELRRRREAERALRESGKRLRITFDETLQLAALLTPEGVIIENNRTAQDFFGYADGETIGRLFWEVSGWREEQRPSVRRMVLEAGEGRVAHGELEVTAQGGERTIVELTIKPITDHRGNVVLLLPEGRDITERKRVEQDRERLLARAAADQRRLQTVFDCAPVPMLLIERDAEDRVVQNALSVDLVGHLGDYRGLVEVCRRPDGSRISLDELPAARAMCGEHVTGEEMMIVREGVDPRAILVSAAPIRDHEDRIVGAVVVADDISPRKEVERLREEWTSIVAHDLRQPISTIAFRAALLAKKPAPDENAKHILACALQLDRMIHDLLDLSRLETHRMEINRATVHLPDLVRQVVERTADATSGHEVEIDVRGEVPPLSADPGRLEQVLVNLLSNAAKYGTPGTPIQVKLERQGGGVLASVENEGDGIEPQEIPKLFSRYHRTTRSRAGGVPGLGLGLYLAKGLIRAHEGRIWAESTPGKVTAFRFLLPIMPQ